MFAAEDLMKISVSTAAGGRRALKRGVQERGVGGQYCPREGGQGEFLALRPALGCQGGPWPWQPLPWAVVNTGFQRGPCSLWEPFSSSLLGLFKPGEEREGTGQACCEEMSLRFPSSPLPQACFLEAPVSKASVSGA